MHQLVWRLCTRVLAANTRNRARTSANTHRRTFQIDRGVVARLERALLEHNIAAHVDATRMVVAELQLAVAERRVEPRDELVYKARGVFLGIIEPGFGWRCKREGEVVN